MTKRVFRNCTQYSKDFILDNHDLDTDFDEQDCKIGDFLCLTNFKYAGIFNEDMSVAWETSFPIKVKDILYVITINDRIVKYGMTETSLPQRHQSLLTGKPKYSKNNKNSETNRRSYCFIEKSLKMNKEVKYYYSIIPSVNIEYISSVDGNSYQEKVSATREEERRLHKLIVSLTKVQPLLNVQTPGGAMKKD